MKNIRIFYLKIFNFLVVKFSIYLNRHVFVMDWINNIFSVVLDNEDNIHDLQTETMSMCYHGLPNPHI